MLTKIEYRKYYFLQNKLLFSPLLSPKERLFNTLYQRVRRALSRNVNDSPRRTTLAERESSK